MPGEGRLGIRALAPEVRKHWLTISNGRSLIFHNIPALRDYEPRVTLYTNQLIQAIERNLGHSMNVSRWFNYYSFDVMGDLAFGKSFNMLVDGRDAYVLTQLHTDMKSVGLFSHLTWLFPFFKRIPGLNADYLKFWGWVEDRVHERIQVSIV
jgi:cytochrome P450